MKTGNDPLIEEAETIAEAILENRYSTGEIGFLSGDSGIAFFLSILGSNGGKQKYLDIGMDIILRTHEEILSGKHSNPTFSGGLAGYSWMLEYLNQQDIISVDTDNLLGEVDEYLYSSMTAFFKEGNFDFLHGAGGIMIYFIRRISGSTQMRDKLVSYLCQAVDFLEELSIPENGMVSWQTIFTNGAKKPITNICLSHGMSSIIVILCKLIEEKICCEKCIPLLRGGLDFINSNRQDEVKYGSFFPTCSLVVDNGPVGSRLGWCYGDLGIANSLEMAGFCLKDTLIINQAKEIFDHIKGRRNLSKNKIEDACLCHGTSGIALYALHQYRRDNSKENKEFLSYWLSSTLKMGGGKTGIEGYMFHNNQLENDQKNLRFNLLEGLAGIGTVLAVAARPENGNLDWIESLLLC